jgi:hypothetical protein
VLFRTVLVAVVSATTLMLSGGIAHADSDDAGMIKLGHMMPLSPASQENAVRKAKQYLNYTAFSHDGLINQLIDAEKFTPSQAEYGVAAAGL